LKSAANFLNHKGHKEHEEVAPTRRTTWWPWCSLWFVLIRSTPLSKLLVVHSVRRAISGSTLVARRAGTNDAIAATAENNTVTATKVVGSSGVRPNNNV